MHQHPVKILFVCLGNICRSPLAEGLFKQHLQQKVLSTTYALDSAGTIGMHAGENPDPRTLRNALAHGIELTHVARQFRTSDFENYDYILVMDRQNYKDVITMAHSEKQIKKVRMLRDFDTQQTGSDVPDPWFGGEQGFEEVYRIIDRSTAGLLAYLEQD